MEGCCETKDGKKVCKEAHGRHYVMHNDQWRWPKDAQPIVGVSEHGHVIIQTASGENTLIDVPVENVNDLIYAMKRERDYLEMHPEGQQATGD